MNVEIGNLYDSAKEVYTKMDALSDEDIENRYSLVYEYLLTTHNNYYMLLCRERNDYTLFHFTSGNEYQVFKDLIDCLDNRGAIKDISIDAGGGIECFITPYVNDIEDKNSYAYYFFPYDAGVIVC